MILHLRARVPEQDIITPKICFGVQLSGFPFRTTSLLIRCHRTGSEACSGNHLPQHRLRGQLGPQWNFKAKRQAFKSM